MSEHHEQVALFQWARAMETHMPELRWLYAVPNGGWRNKVTAARLKEEGVKPGVPDVQLPVPRGGWHGLAIEMKYGRNKPTPEQRAWLDHLTRSGYYTAVCYSYEEAAQTILDYLGEANK